MCTLPVNVSPAHHGCYPRRHLAGARGGPHILLRSLLFLVVISIGQSGALFCVIVIEDGGFCSR